LQAESLGARTVREFPAMASRTKALIDNII
jgi:hypothetical protein